MKPWQPVTQAQNAIASSPDSCPVNSGNLRIEQPCILKIKSPIVAEVDRAFLFSVRSAAQPCRNQILLANQRGMNG